MNINKNKRFIIIAITSFIICLISLYINEYFEGSDTIYTSLFYIPVITTGLWYYRFTIPLATAFAVYFDILDFIELDRVSVDQIFRGLIMILGAVVLYYLGKTLSKKNQELKTSGNLLAIEKERLRIMLLSIGEGVISTDINGNVTFLTEVAKRLTGWLDESAIGRPFTEVFEIINEYTREKSDNPIKNVLDTGEVIALANHTVLISKDGTERPIADSAAPIRDEGGNIAGVILVFRDVTGHKKVEDALRESEEKYRFLAENISDVISVFNITKNKFTYVSPSVLNLRGLTVEEAMNESLEESLTPETLVVARNEVVKNIKDFMENPKEPNYYITQGQQPCKNGDIIWVEISRKYQYNSEGDIESVGVIRNIEKRKKAEKQVLYISYHDQLTGLYNRRFYEEELRRLDTERNYPMTIVMADVNGLKLINDSFGHVMGDELLKKCAEVIKRGCRADDIIARLGGDEFIIILPKTDAFETKQIIKRINNLSAKEKVGTSDISISFGYETKNKEEDIQEVFKKAEDHMYKKKLFESPSMRVKTIGAIISTLHEKNKSEEQHSFRVSALCKRMGEALGLPENKIEELKSVGLLHDIGKIALDENILNKLGKLTDDEWKEIKRHPEIGYRILSTVNDMSEMAEYVLAHHERWDGQGYPKGLKGEEIPYISRIIAISDSYDAMTSDRNYRKALSEEETIDEIRRCSGVQYDPDIVKVFIEKVLGKELE